MGGPEGDGGGADSVEELEEAEDAEAGADDGAACQLVKLWHSQN